MNAWMWWALAVAVWASVSLPVALWLGRVLRARNGQRPAVKR